MILRSVIMSSDFILMSEMTPIKIVNKLMNLVNEMAQERLNLTTADDTQVYFYCKLKS